jgi:protein-disulfide isomerase
VTEPAAKEPPPTLVERLTRNPWLLGGAFVASALLGAALFAAIQALVPGMSDRARTEAIVREYILAHGEILPEAMDRLDQRQIAERAKVMEQAPRYIAAHRAMIFDPYEGALQGNPRGDITVAAYLDYNCGYCRASLPAIAELVAKDSNVRIVYREFPVLGPDSVTAARWALAAAEQGKFIEFHKALYAGRPDAAGIAKAAGAAGLDTGLAKRALAAPRVQAEIEKNLKVASQLGSGGATPFWVVGDKVISGLVDYERLAAAVAAARARK